MVYGAINQLLINHIPEITFPIVTFIYVFFYHRLIIFLEKIVRGGTQAAFENRPGIVRIFRMGDSFVIFIVSIFFIIPLLKKILEKYLEPKLETPYLFFIVLGIMGVAYLYYILIYTKHLHDNR